MRWSTAVAMLAAACHPAQPADVLAEPAPVETPPPADARPAALRDEHGVPPMWGAEGPEATAEAHLRLVRATFVRHFAPPVTVVEAHPDARVTVHVALDPTSGAVLGFELVGASGLAELDAAALRAVGAVERVPVPRDGTPGPAEVTLVFAVR